MRTMEIKMKQQGLFSEGHGVTITEGILPSNYYYIIDGEFLPIISMEERKF